MPAPLLVASLAACGCSGEISAEGSADAATSIARVQGSGRASPLVGQAVVVEGVVSGDFQAGDADTSRNLGGFYLQGPADGDPATSDGVFVFDGDSPDVDVGAGDRVRVAGEVVEYFGETQVVAASVTVIGSGEVEPVPVALPWGVTRNSDGQLIADLEAVEGMLVRFPQSLTVSQLRDLERFGEVLLSEGGRQYAYTNINPPDTAGFAAHREAVAGRRIHLDDGLRTDNTGAALPIRNGDEVSNLTGVVRYSRGSGAAGTEAYRLMPTVRPQFDNANPRPGAPSLDGSLRIATFNLDAYFSTVDDGRRTCGPSRDAPCRGADSARELARQLEKIVTVLVMMDADVVGLIELENNAEDSLRTIVDAVNASLREDRYDFVDTGTIGDDAIKVGLLYRPGTVRPAGEFAILDNRVDPRFDDTLNRPVLAQSFDSVASDLRFTVAVNHLKSKGSSCESSGDPDIGDGQDDCSATRSLAASAMVDWLASDPTGSGSGHVLAIGDFNTHTKGDALSRFESAGYVNLASRFPGTTGYSFEFDGQFGSLDHAMASPSFAEKVVDALEWRINADEPGIHDYNLEFGRDPSVFNGSEPYRASDHDPLIIGIDPES